MWTLILILLAEMLALFIHGNSEQKLQIIVIVNMVLVAIVGSGIVYLGNGITTNIGTPLYMSALAAQSILLRKGWFSTATLNKKYVVNTLVFVAILNIILSLRDQHQMVEHFQLLKITMGSLIAFTVSQVMFIRLYHKLRHTNEYVQIALACFASLTIDSVLFYTIALNFSTSLVLMNIGIKAIMLIALTPVILLSTRKRKES